ncbi:alpha/beta fold hydrolase [Nocardia sp. NPDC058480]|uniref:alpha/beta fold hydrolase n=1 Tax=Nocardia sp. NPDC058480 TaxID=3346522 RepID=UPI003658AC6C
MGNSSGTSQPDRDPQDADATYPAPPSGCESRRGGTVTWRLPGCRRHATARAHASTMTRQSQFIEVHGYRRAFRMAGTGPPLLLIHGITDSSGTWAPVFDALAEHYTVIAPDLLGHGESAKPRADYAVAAYANGMRDLLSILGIERITVVGHSLGGGVAMQFAYQFPEKVERIALVCPPPRPDHHHARPRLPRRPPPDAGHRRHPRYRHPVGPRRSRPPGFPRQSHRNLRGRRPFPAPLRPRPLRRTDPLVHRRDRSGRLRPRPLAAHTPPRPSDSRPSLTRAQARTGARANG